MLIFFKCNPGLCPREIREVNCCPAHTLFHKGRYANSPYRTTLPTLPYHLASAQAGPHVNSRVIPTPLIIELTNQPPSEQAFLAFLIAFMLRFSLFLCSSLFAAICSARRYHMGTKSGLVSALHHRCLGGHFAVYSSLARLKLLRKSSRWGMEEADLQR